MTYSNYKKAFKQLKAKPVKMQKFIKHNATKPRNHGTNLFRCRRCGRTRGHILKYGLKLCRQCFRESALNLGFKKYS